MKLQHGKCAYCERQLESEDFGKVEHDLEHFRPKKKARPWKLTSALEQAGITLTSPSSGSFDPGYHLLAYHPQNYCTSCKPCNSTMKSDYFPIAGPRTCDGEEPTQLVSEKPFLVNPVGDFDDAPESLITFRGLSPMAAQNAGHKKHRGLVCIAFFRLDDLRRKYLFRERANIIVSIHSFMRLADIAATQAEKNTYENLVSTLISEKSPHTNCARSFRELFLQNRGEADDIFERATDYLESISN